MYGEDGGPARGLIVVVVALKPKSVVDVTLLMFSRFRNVVYAVILKLMLLRVDV